MQAVIRSESDSGAWGVDRQLEKRGHDRETGAECRDPDSTDITTRMPRIRSAVNFLSRAM